MVSGDFASVLIASSFSPWVSARLTRAEHVNERSATVSSGSDALRDDVELDAVHERLVVDRTGVGGALA
jgi:hypothetical protein